MATIPSEKIAEVRDRVDIESVVGRSVRLTRRGKRLIGLCPFHNEKTPSFGVDPDKKLYHCFGCNAGGDVFDFVMRIEGIDFREAVTSLAREVGVELEAREEDPREREIRLRREALWNVNRAAAEFFQRALAADPRAREYLIQERKLRPETIARFELGFAPDAWQALADHLRERRLDVSLGHTSGLLGHSKENGRTYDRFRGRIMFPIRLPSGDVAGFGARRADWIEREGPKYLNSPESPVYDKSSILYGLFHAKDEVRKSRRAVLVEGYLDVIALHQVGLPVAVAACGTALSARHAAILKKLAGQVVLMYDGDAAGQEATRKAAELLLQEGAEVRVVELPEGEDPDTFAAKAGKAELEARLDAAPSAIDFFVFRAKSAYKGAGIAGMAKAVEAIKPLLLAVRDPLARDVSIAACARAFDIDPSLLRRHLSGKSDAPNAPSARPDRDGGDVSRRAAGPGGHAPTERPAAASSRQGGPSSSSGGSTRMNTAPPPVVETALLRLFVETPSEVLRALEELDARHAFTHPAIQAALDAGVEALRRGMPFDAPRALEAVSASGHADDATLVSLRRTLMEPRPERDDIVVCVKRLLRSRIDITVQHLLQRLAKEADPRAAEELAAEADRLNRIKASLV